MKKPQRNISPLDKLVLGIDHVLKTVDGGASVNSRPSPAAQHDAAEPELSSEEKRHISGLMRINHTGEVCAQALYRGQALASSDKQVQQSMETSAQEEEDHLAWCEERLTELGSQPSVLNPVFYGLSFGIGALAGAAGDKWSLGFVAATEDQVCKHLQSHLEQLPEKDVRSNAILTQMLEDEAHHAAKALDAGGAEFHPVAKTLMTAMSTIMTKTTYLI